MRFLFFLISLMLGLPVLANNIMDMRVYGDEAPTKMYLFTSLVCPHCAQFHQDVLPEIQKKYLDTHKTQLIIVDMLMNKPNLMGAMLLRCAPADKVEKMETALYDNQEIWTLNENKARVFLAEIALKNGISAGEFETCLANQDLAKAITTDQHRMSQVYGVKHMPTLIVRQGDKTASWEGADKELIIEELADFFK